jgi:cation:H+ antiporter
LGIGVSELFIGLTIVAIGTSLPEVVASATAVIAGQSQLAITNIVGSTIINMTLIIGVSAIVSPLASNAVVIDRDAKIMIFILSTLALFIFDPFTPGAIAIWEAIVLLVLFMAYLSFLFTRREECESCYQFSVFVDYLIRFQFLTSLGGLLSYSRKKPDIEPKDETDDREEERDDSKPKTFRNAATVVLSALTIILGAQFVVTGSNVITQTWGIQPGVIGFVIIALGTSLPELTVSINSARRGFGRLLIGNIIGSNIINITLGVGFVSLFLPLTVELLLGNTIIILMTLVFALLFFVAIRRDWRVTKREGVILVTLFFIAQVITIYFEQFAV